jgi:DNA-binding beta-propeller fold protein YncE
MAGDTGWDYCLADGAAGRVFLSRGDHVDVLDIKKGAVVAAISGTAGVHGVALAPDLGKGFISCGKSGTVRIFDLAGLVPGPELKAGENPDAIVYEPKTRRVFAFNGKSRDVTAIDAVSQRVIGTTPLECKPEFAAVDGSGKVYFNREDKDSIGVLDAASLKVTAVWPLKAKRPSGLAIDPTGGHLFSVCDGGKMEIVDTADGAVIAEAPIGERPDAAAFDPGTGWAFSSNGAGSLTVIDARAPGFPVLQELKTRQGARTLSLDTLTHTVYLLTAEFLPVPKGGEGSEGHHPRLKPGSVVLLVAERH